MALLLSLFQGTGLVTDKRPRKVLIAQLNSVRSYRVRFYEVLEQRRPPTWQFQVVHDCDPKRVRMLYHVYIDPATFRFPILDVRTFFLSDRRRDLVWQNFLLKSRHYDMIVTDTVLSNLTYLFINIWRLCGKKRGFWGHSANLNVQPSESSFTQQIGRHVKPWLIRSADMFFAYTRGEYENLLRLGFSPDRIVVLNNTIDTATERKTFLELLPLRECIREELGLEGREIVVYLGRLMGIKCLDLLFEAVTELRRERPQVCLVVAGSGPGKPDVLRQVEKLGPEAARHFDCNDEAAAARLLTAADLYCLPGQVGLAPLRALCYDLPVVFLDQPFHSPEVEYLTPANSRMLPADVSAQEFAAGLAAALDYWKTPEQRAQLFPTIAHLTIENMVDNFIEGVNRALKL
jgi:glycosyltransferase involved in cell wall biosynthesis